MGGRGGGRGNTKGGQGRNGGEKGEGGISRRPFRGGCYQWRMKRAYTHKGTKRDRLDGKHTYSEEWLAVAEANQR